MAYLQKENVYEVKTILRLPGKLSTNLKLRRGSKRFCETTYLQAKETLLPKAL